MARQHAAHGGEVQNPQCVGSDPWQHRAVTGLWILLVNVVAIAWPLFARPSRRSIAIGLAGTVAFVGCAIAIAFSVSDLQGRARTAWYPLPASSGRQVLTVKTNPGVPGVHAHLVGKQPHAAVRRPGCVCLLASIGCAETAPSRQASYPFSWERVREANWRVRTGGVMAADGETCGEPRDDACIADILLRDGESGQVPIEIEYEVNEQTRAVIEGSDLAISYPFSYGNDIAMGTAIGVRVFWGMVAGAILGAIATSVGAWRFRRTRGLLALLVLQ